MKPIVIAGPCVIEEKTIMMDVANRLCEIRDKYNIEIYFKSSFDKANRTSLNSYRGPGLYEGLRLLSDIRCEFALPIVTDVHETYQVKEVCDVVDIIQIPAFLCRQTDLIVAASKTGKIVNIKKGQFMSGEDMRYSVEKAMVSGAKYVMVTERGNCFGYNNIVVDFRNIPIMKSFCGKVVMDCTHSVQMPGALSGVSGGNPKYIESMALAAKAFGAEGFFFEVHPEPLLGKCDSACMLKLDKLESIIEKIV